MEPKILINAILNILCNGEITDADLLYLKCVNDYDIDSYFINKFSVPDEEKSEFEDFKKYVKFLYHYVSQLSNNKLLINDNDFIFKLQHVVYTCYYKHLFYDKFPNQEVLIKEIKDIYGDF